MGGKREGREHKHVERNIARADDCFGIQVHRYSFL